MQKRVGDAFVWKHIELFILPIGWIRCIYLCVCVMYNHIFYTECYRSGGWSMTQEAHNKD